MSDERPMSARDRRVALGVVVACLVYAGSLAIQTCVPALRAFLVVDLGGGAKPTYYLRVVLSLMAAGLAVGIDWAARRSVPPVSERLIAWTTGVLVGVGALLVVMFP